jgi:hypothetical protein
MKIPTVCFKEESTLNNENKNEIVTVQETNSSQENAVFEKKIGRTRYHVHLFFDPNSKETMQQKIMRMMKNELEAELDKPA